MMRTTTQNESAIAQVILWAKWPSIIIFLILFSFGCAFWPGGVWNYILFSITYFLLIAVGLQRRSSFGYLFIAITFFIGYWLKLTLHQIFPDLTWTEPTGLFDFSSDSWNVVAKLSLIGAVSVILAGLCWKGRIEDNQVAPNINIQGKARILMWGTVFVSALAIIFLNESLNIQHAGVAQPDLGWPWPLQGLFNWYSGANFILLLGVTYLELLRKDTPWFGLLAFLLTSSAIAISFGSRGMVAFESALLVSYLIFFGSQCRWMTKTRLSLVIILCICAIVATATIAQMRREAWRYQVTQEQQAGQSLNQHSAVYPTLIFSHYTLNHLINLPIERWVGLEGLMAVSAYPGKGPELLLQAITEKGETGRIDMYTSEICKSGTYNALKSAYVTLPGIFAYWYYSNSFVIMFCAVFLLVMVTIAGERAIRKLTGNPLLAMSIGLMLAIGINMSPGGIFVPVAMMVLNFMFALLIGIGIKKLANL